MAYRPYEAVPTMPDMSTVRGCRSKLVASPTSIGSTKTTINGVQTPKGRLAAKRKASAK